MLKNLMLKDLIKKVEYHLTNNKTLENFNYDFSNHEFNLKDYKFDDDKYLKHLLFRNEDFEIFIYTWGKNSKTPKHNHPSKGCRLFVLNGELIEERFLKNNKKIITSFSKGDSSYMHDKIGLHRVTTIKPAHTVHIYSPPKFFDKNI